MPFDLMNADVTYQELIDREFRAQIGVSLEAYVDDMVNVLFDEDGVRDSGIAYWLRLRLWSTSSLGTSVMFEGFQAKTSRLFARIWASWFFTWDGRSTPIVMSLLSVVICASVWNSTTDLNVDTSKLSFWIAVLLSMTLYLDVDLTIWNCNMIVLDSGSDPTMSVRSTTPLG
ncbi:hypothetical protein Tco_0383360 [Tanacetum coccineum]